MLTLDDAIRAIGGEWTLLAGILGREQALEHKPGQQPNLTLC